jgi:hypothetical protein
MVKATPSQTGERKSLLRLEQSPLDDSQKPFLSCSGTSCSTAGAGREWKNLFPALAVCTFWTPQSTRIRVSCASLSRARLATSCATVSNRTESLTHCSPGSRSRPSIPGASATLSRRCTACGCPIIGVRRSCSSHRPKEANIRDPNGHGRPNHRRETHRLQGPRCPAVAQLMSRFRHWPRSAPLRWRLSGAASGRVGGAMTLSGGRSLRSIWWS